MHINCQNKTDIVHENKNTLDLRCGKIYMQYFKYTFKMENIYIFQLRCVLPNSKYPSQVKQTVLH